MAYLRPVVSYLSRNVFLLLPEAIHEGQHFQFRVFGKVIHRVDMNRILKEYASKHIQYMLTIKDWRQITDSLIRRFILPNYLHYYQKLRDWGIHGGHGPTTHQQWYGLEEGDMREVDIAISIAQARELLQVGLPANFSLQIGILTGF